MFGSRYQLSDAHHLFPNPPKLYFFPKSNSVFRGAFLHGTNSKTAKIDTTLQRRSKTSPNERIVERAFSELAREEAAEKARSVWADIAFEHSSSREEFLVRLNQHISHVKSEQDLTVDSLNTEASSYKQCCFS